MMMRLSAVALVLVGVSAVAAQQTRDAAPVAAGTASISGRVFADGAAKQAARRVRVTLTNVARTSPGQTATTDDAGAFMFASLPAGRYELQAVKTGYLRASYGASRPERAGTPVVVKDGEAITNLSMTIARGGVITGVVRDVRGQPLPGQTMRVLKLGYHTVTGERALAAVSSGSSVMTDDRGEYRAFGLPPGGYIVMVNPTSGRSGGPGEDIRVLTSEEVRRALQSARGGAAPAVAPAAGTPSAPAQRVNYTAIFHPGVANVGAAATITLGLSEERTGVDVTVQLVPTATIFGTVTSAAGPIPKGLTISATPAGADAGMLAAAGSSGLSTTIGPDGTYRIAGVPPGSYRVSSIVGRGRADGPGSPMLSAAAEVTVAGLDVDVPLTLQPGADIAGRVGFEGVRPSAGELQALSFQLIRLGSGGTPLYTGAGRGVVTTTGDGRVDAEGRFTFSSVPPGDYWLVPAWLNAGAGESWTMKSSAANGRDAFEAPLRVNQNEPINLAVTFTGSPTALAGVLQDQSGRAATDYYILVFSTDRQRWTPGSRRVRMARPGTDGAFSALGFPPGEYFVAALTDLEPGEWNDPALLEQIAAAAVKVTLRDGQTTSQNFKIN